MTEDTITVPAEDRVLTIREESFIITVPPEWRTITVLETMLIASKQHTVGDIRQWVVQYDRWLANTATIEQIAAQSDSNTCTVDTPVILGTDIVFFLSGGTLGERVTVELTMTDSIGNIKHDTVKFTVVAP
jgi:hypothetical protein